MNANDKGEDFGWKNHAEEASLSGPDLRCQSLGSLDINGSQITILDYKIKNTGLGASSVSYVGYYLSTDQNFTTDDIYLGRDYVEGLARNESSTEEFVVDVSGMDIPNGEYFVGTVIDYLDSVQELDENNNNDCFWTGQKVVVGGKPNLACKGLGEFTLDGLDLKIGWVKVENNGDAPAGASKVGFYLSTDRNFTTDDEFLGSIGVGALNPGTFEMIPKFEIDLATLDLPAGRYYVGYIIDYLDEVNESNEDDNNNCSYDEVITIEGIPSGDPNLVCKERGDLVIDGDRAIITGTRVQNSGDAASVSGQVGFYLSSNAIITTNDLLVKTQALNALAAGETQAFGEIVINLDDYDLDPGTYFLGIIIDDTNETEEAEEGDNSCFWNTPKYEVDEGKPNLACKARGEFIVNNNTGYVYFGWTTVANYGDATAGAHQIGFYASLDETYSDEDVLVATRDIGSLAPGESQMIEEVETNYNGLGLAPGTYTLIVVIDHLDEVHESNEDDNDDCFWDEGHIFIPNGQADLVCAQLGELIIDNSNLSYYLSWNRIKNQGSRTAGASEVGYYVSKDTIFSSDDSLLFARPVPALAPGETYLVEEMRDTLRLNLASGLYNVLVVIDHKNQVAESNEDNNTDCFYKEPRFYIPPGKPDLACKTLGELIIDNNDLSYYIGWTTVINNGTTTAGESKIGFYVSTDPMLSNDDELFASQTIGELAPGASQMITPIEDVLDLDLEPGTYYVLSKIDYLNEVQETNEANNDDCYWDEPRFYIPDDVTAPNLTCKERGFLTVNGNQVSISSLKITNTGNDFSGISRVGIYLSENQVFSSSDILIGSVLIPKLSPGQIFNVNFDRNVADLNLAAGEYFVGIIVDKDSQVEESDETDNKSCSWVSPKVNSIPAEPNLTCASAGELVITNHTQLKFSWMKVKNTGDARAGNSKIGFYLSRDRNITTSDIFLGSRDVGSLEAGESIMPGAFNVDVASLDLDDGHYFAGFIVDYNNKVEESNEGDNNNCSYDNKVHIDKSKIDLVCDSRGEVEVNGTVVKISWFKVKNIGNKRAPANKIGFYLSSDNHFTTSDFFIGSRNIEALDPGEVDLISALTVDVANLNIPPGTYHIGSFIDYTKIVDEENEYNNNDCYFTKKVTIPQPKPDLTCKDRGELSINDNRHVHVSWTKIMNSGDGRSDATKVGIYLSRDQNFTTSDTKLGDVHLPSLAPGEVKLLSAFNKDISYLNLSPGKYYVGIIIDPHNTVHESKEYNNNDCSWSHPYIDIQPPKPNLTCMSKGEISASGSTIHISWMKVKNNGGSTAGASYVGYYLSKDTHFSTSDTRIGSKYLSSIAAGQTKTVDGITINLSSLNLTPGEYFIGMIVDYKNDVHESNEHDNNDCFFHSPKVVVHPPKPNLTCMSKGELSVSGTTVHYSWGKVKNDGGSTAGAHHVGYYLSTDQHFSTSDYLIGEDYLSSLAAGAVRTLPAFNVDAADKHVPAGTYYFGVVIDNKQQVHESDEYDNNDCYFSHPKVTIPSAKPDLKCKSLGEISLNGDQLHLSWSKVMNAGSGASAQTRVGYYLSTNTSINPSEDVYIGSRVVPALSAGQTATIAAININLSHLNLNSGSYYIGYYIDDQYHVHESNEHNNTCYWTSPKYQKENGKPNLTLKNGSGHLSFSNNVLHFSDIKVINYGNADAGASKLGYYLSGDATIDPRHDILLGEDHVSALAPGAHSTESENISLTGLNIPPGTYWVGIYIDHKYQVHESVEHDNKFRFTQRISIQNGNSKPDLTCIDAGQLKIQNSGKRIRIEGLKVSNIGHATANPSKIGYYLSRDKNFTTDDYLIGTRTTSAILAGKTAVILFAEDIPEDIPSGNYYVGMIVDYDNRITEKDETNNRSCYFNDRITVSNSSNGGGGSNGSDYCACSNYNNRTFCESFDSYRPGYLSNQSNCWTTWSGSTGGAEDGMIENSNGNQYLSIKANSGDKQDVLLMLGDRDRGNYSVEFKMWMFNGHQGYFNILHNHFQGNGEHAYEVYFNGNGTGYIRAEGRNHTFSYPTFEWFTVRQEFNLTTDKVSVIINGGLVAEWKFSSTPNSNRGTSKQLAALNFYPATAQNQFYVDDIRFTTINNADDDNGVESRNEEQLPAPILEESTETALPNLMMSYYPNPAKEQLTVEFDAQQTVDIRVELVNAMGQIVTTYEEDGVSFIRHQFDLSQQAAGMYYIRAWAGDQQIVRPVIVTD